MSPEEIKYIYVLTGTLLLVLGLIAFFVYTMIRRYNGYLTEMKRYDREKILALEKERELIAADLHDDIGPILSATTFKLGGIEPATEREKKLLEESRDHINHIFQRVKLTALRLVPRALEMQGPLFGIQDFVNKFMRDQRLQITIHPLQCPGISLEKSLHLFRMMQEIIQNAVRHSQAKTLAITGNLNEGVLTINTEDDGVGYEKKDRRQNGLGLQNLGIRAEIIGASLKTEAAPGKGTKYQIQLSID